MGKFFENLNLVLIAGLVLAVLIAVFPDTGYAPAAGVLNGVFFGTWAGFVADNGAFDELEHIADTNVDRAS